MAELAAALGRGSMWNAPRIVPQKDRKLGIPTGSHLPVADDDLHLLGFSGETEPLGDVCVYVCVNFHKELAHMILEANKSTDLQPASWRPRVSPIPVQVPVQGSQARSADSYSAFLFYSDLQRLGRGPPIGREICFF